MKTFTIKNLFLIALLVSLFSCSNSDNSKLSNYDNNNDDKYEPLDAESKIIVMSFLNGFWYFAGDEVEKWNDAQMSQVITFHISNDTLRFTNKIRQSEVGVYSSKYNVYVPGNSSVSSGDGYVDIVKIKSNTTSSIHLLFKNYENIIQKTVYINFPADVKTNIDSHVDYLKKSIHYEKMILSKEGRNFNNESRNSLIFVDLRKDPSWDGKDITYFLNVSNKYEFEAPTLSINGSSEYGLGYKCFVPNVTKYDSKYSFKDLKVAQIQEEIENQDLDEDNQNQEFIESQPDSTNN